MKWCKRIDSALAGVTLKKGFMASNVKEAVFLEAIDCFCGSVDKKDIRRQLINIIGKMWDITSERVQYCCEFRKPIIRGSPTTFQTGRVIIPKNQENQVSYMFSTFCLECAFIQQLVERTKFWGKKTHLVEYVG